MPKCNTPEEFRKLLVEMIKACGEELIERAEDLVGNGDLISDFNIWLEFPTDGRMLTGCPTIEVCRQHCSDRATKVLVEFYDRKREVEQDG